MIGAGDWIMRQLAAAAGLIALVLALGGCESSINGGGSNYCPGPDCPDAGFLTDDQGNPVLDDQGKPKPKPDIYKPPVQQDYGTNPKPDAQVKLPDCKKDSDCKSPLVCHIAGGKCVPPEAKQNGTCDPVEGILCPAGFVCVAGICIKPPGGCKDNSKCPIGYYCLKGVCVKQGGGGCPKVPCPTGQVCINGKCVPKKTCKVKKSPTRMNGKWRLDSQLKVRDGLKGFAKGLLTTATTLQGVISGNFSIKGLPSWASKIVGNFLKGVISKYVPPWAANVIQLLSHIDDAIDDTRVVSLEYITALGNYQYKGYSEWLLVEFEWKGQKVSNKPQNIPGVGSVKTTQYTAREICNVFFIDKHKVKNQIGHIYKWAVEALITGISCAMKSTPCYKTIQAMFGALINCPALAKAVAGSTSLVPGLEQMVLAACQSQKQTIVKMLVDELNKLAANITYMELAGTCDITGNSDTLTNGKWKGTLGGAYGAGNFEGTFKGNKQP